MGWAPVKVTRFKRLIRAGKLDVCRGLVDALSRADADLLHIQVPNPTMILALQIARPAYQLWLLIRAMPYGSRILNLLYRPIEKLAYRPRQPNSDDKSQLCSRFNILGILCRSSKRFADGHKPGALPQS